MADALNQVEREPEQPKWLTVEADISAPLRQEVRKWIEDGGKTQM